MPEEQEQYGNISKEKTELLFTAKRLADISKDLDKLTEEDKKLVIEKADKLNE